MEESTKQEITTRSAGVRYGIYSGLAGVILFLIPAMLGQNAFQGLWSWIGIPIGITLLVLAHKYFKDEGNGFMSYGQGVGVGFWMALTSTLIGGVVIFVYVTFLDSSPFDLMLEEQLIKMQEAGSPDNAIEMAQDWTKKLFWPMYFIFGIIGGVFGAVIVSIFTQKKNPAPIF